MKNNRKEGVGQDQIVLELQNQKYVRNDSNFQDNNELPKQFELNEEIEKNDGYQQNIQAEVVSTSISQQQTGVKSSKSEAIMNLFKGYIGSGILAIPYAFDQAGWLLSMIVLAIIAIMLVRTFYLLFEIAENYGEKEMSYQEICNLQFGQKGLYMVRFFMLVSQVGCCVSYVIFFLKFFEHVFHTAGNPVDDVIYLAIALAVILPMGLINNMTLFKKSSIIGNVLVAITLLTIFGYNFDSISNDDIDKNVEDQAQWEKLAMMFGTSLYSLGAITIILPLRNSLEEKNDIKSIFDFVNTSSVIILILFGVTGVLARGQQMNEIYLFALKGDGRIDVSIVQILYALALLTSYPLQLLPAFNIIEEIKILQKYVEKGKPHYKKIRFIFRSFLSVLICIAAYLIPRFAVLVNIIGAVSGAGLQFIIPITMHYKMFKDRISKPNKYYNFFLLGVGVLGGIIAFIMSVIELINPSEED